jgi:hypothetical protein
MVKNRIDPHRVNESLSVVKTGSPKGCNCEVLLPVPGSASVLAGFLKAPAFGRIGAGEDAGAPRGTNGNDKGTSHFWFMEVA